MNTIISLFTAKQIEGFITKGYPSRETVIKSIQQDHFSKGYKCSWSKAENLLLKEMSNK